MRNKLFRKCLVIGIIILFVGACVVPSISGNIRTNSKESDEKNVYIANHIGLSVDDWVIIDTVGWWHFDEGTGSTAYDSSTYDNDGSCSSTQWTTDTPDASPYALEFFASSNSYVGVGDDPSLDFNDLGENEGFMIDFYMKKTSTPPVDYAGLVCKQYYGGYLVIYHPNGKIGFYICSASESYWIYSETIIDDNDWHHIVAVWDTASATMYLYIDDMTDPDNTLYVGEFTIKDVSKGLDIGNDWPTDDDNPFNGKIDEVQISIIRTNDPPNPPSNPSPDDDATDVDVDAILSWECSDPDGDDLVYDVYFEANDPTPDELVSYHQSQTYYNPPGQMEYNTQYYWQIVAEDEYGATTNGPIWSFTTIDNNPPNEPSNPAPYDGEINVYVNHNLYWDGGDPDGDSVTYDVYFGTSTPPPLEASGISFEYYDPGTMDWDTMYYWRIIAEDEHGAYTPGPIWSFTTEEEPPNDPPDPPSDPSPEDGATGIDVEADLSWTCSDPDGDDLFYDVYFEANDPDPDVLVSDDQTVTTYDPGTLLYETNYYWRIIAKDEHGASTPGPIWHFTTEISNKPPEDPIINGPTSGKPGQTYSYTFVAIDPNEDDVYYEIDWGDGIVDPWDGPHGSNVVITRNHVWDERGDYTIRARAKDEYDAIGDWSEFEVTITKKSRGMNIPFLNWLQSYLNLFPILQKILLLLQR